MPAPHRISLTPSVPSIVLRKFSQPPARQLLEQRRVQVAAGAPFAVRDVFQAGGHQHQRGFPVGERADHAGPAPDFPVQALDGVVRAYAPPMLAGHLASRQRLGEALAHDLGGLLQLHRLELGGHRLDLGRRGLARLHGVDGLEYGRDLGALRFGDLGQRIAVEAHGAALVFGPGEHLGDRSDHAGGLVAGEHAHAAQPSRLQLRQEAAPAFLGFREALGAADDLAVAVIVHADRRHRRHVLVGASPAVLEVDAVDAGVRIGAGQRPAPPLVDRLERLLVEIGDRAGGDAGAPTGSR